MNNCNDVQEKEILVDLIISQFNEDVSISKKQLEVIAGRYELAGRCDTKTSIPPYKYEWQCCDCK